jgi:hypothetical protein
MTAPRLSLRAATLAMIVCALVSQVFAEAWVSSALLLVCVVILVAFRERSPWP